MLSHNLNHPCHDRTIPQLTPARSRRRIFARLSVGLAVVAAVGVSSGCGAASPAQVPAAEVTSIAPSGDRGALTVRDAWVKSAPGGMTAVFGVLVNPSSAPITVVSAETSASDHAELHTTVVVDGVPQMRTQPAGFTVAANAEHVLQPGGDHIMVMGLRGAVLPGDEVAVSLHLSDGRSVRFAALAKQTSAGSEHYASPSSTATPSDAR